MIKCIPVDDEISKFRMIKHMRSHDRTEDWRSDIVHFENERIFDYVNQLYFESNTRMSLFSIRNQDEEAARDFVREVFRTRYDLKKINTSDHRETVSDILFSDHFNLSRLSFVSTKNNINISEEIAVGIQESIDFFVDVDPILAESYIDLLGQLMIEMVEQNGFDRDPSSTFFWSGIALRMLISRHVPNNICIKLLDYFEKAIDIITSKQKDSLNPVLEKVKKTICEEVFSVKKYQDSEIDTDISKKAEVILEKYSDVKLGNL